MAFAQKAPGPTDGQIRGAQRPTASPSDLFTAIALVAVANGVLIELVMLGWPLYGMTRRATGCRVVGPRLAPPFPRRYAAAGSCSC